MWILQVLVMSLRVVFGTHVRCYMANRDLKTPSVGVCILISQMLRCEHMCTLKKSESVSCSVISDSL